VIETKKEIAILTVAVAALALAALISPVSAGFVETDVELVGTHTFDGTNSIWTYRVTAGTQADISHWVLAWCNKSNIVSVQWQNPCDGTSYTHYSYGLDPKTGITGIKFELPSGNPCGGVVLKETSALFYITLKGDYYEKPIEVATKSGGSVEKDRVTGPRGFDEDPCDPIPELPTIILLGAGLLALAGYVGLRRKKG